jgi:enoyl-CoA hydratase/carnithine racemase
VSEAVAALLHQIDATVARIRIDGPEVHNALSPEVMEGLQQGLERAARDPVRKGR